MRFKAAAWAAALKSFLVHWLLNCFRNDNLVIFFYFDPFVRLLSVLFLLLQCGEGIIENGHPFLHLLVGDHQRHHGADYVAVLTAG